MGLIFVRLVEYRRAEGPSKDLLHLLVIEEAHRLLTNVGERREEEGNPRGKAVETFANLLSEIRAYGQGVLIADQVPVKLAPDVIKNTNLKIAHRVVAADDRAALAGAMAMSERQAHVLATLERGQAAVFSEGDDAPLAVLVPLVKGAGEAPVPTDEQVARRAVELPALVPYRALFQPLQKEVGFALEDERAWEAARHIVGTTAFQRSFARLALSVIEAAEALDRLWPDLLAQVRARRSQAVDEESLLRCVAVVAAEWLALRRGAQAGWSYSETQGLADRLQALLIAKVSATAVVDECTAFREYALQLHFRQFDPFPACSRICRQQPPQCLYRFAARDLIADEALAQAWDLEFQPVNRQTWERCMDAGYALIEFASEEWPGEKIEAADAAARRASLCFGQQMLTQQLMKSPHEARFWVGKLIAEAHHE
jgi:hypothetical protein